MSKSTQRKIALATVIIFISCYQLPTALAAPVLVFSNEINEQNANTMILDDDDTGGDVILQFGATVNERLYWNNGGTTFVFTDDLNVTGGLDVDGTITAGSGGVTLTNAAGNIDGEIIADGTIDDDSIDWADVTSTDITFDADTVATTAVGNGSTSLEETTGAADSGASIVGVYDDFDNATTANVQAVLKEFDTAITAAGGHVQNTDTGTTSNIFTLDNDDTAGNVDLVFGTTAAQYLRHDGTLFHFSDDVRMAVASGVEFRDSALKISSSADGQLDIDADTEVEITATTVDLNGILDVSGNTAVGGTLDVTSTIEAGSGNITLTNAAGNIDGEVIADDTIDDDSIDWADVTSTDITFDADTVATTAVGNGTTSLEETTAADDSGAVIVGAFDEFDNSDSANVQDVLDDLDAAITTNTNNDANSTKTINIPISDVAVIADGTANLADIYLDTVAGDNPHQYYVVKTTQGTLQDLDLKVKIQLPADFVDFTSTNDLYFNYKTTTVLNTENKIDILVEDDAGTDSFTAADGQGKFSAVADTWYTWNDEFDAGTYAAGDFIYVTIKGYSTTSKYAHIGELVISYTGTN